MKGTQEEGRVQTDPPSTRETQPCCQGAGGGWDHTLGTELPGQEKALDSTYGPVQVH